MGKAAVEYQEIRFVIEDELTQAYVFCRAIGDCPTGVQGWHHKTFPKSVAVTDIFQKMFGGADDCLLWPLNAPK